MFPRMATVSKDDIISKKCIYSLVQAARQYYEKAIQILKKVQIIGGNVDPCFYMKKSAKGAVYIDLYVDNKLIIRNLVVIDESTEAH